MFIKAFYIHSDKIIIERAFELNNTDLTEIIEIETVCNLSRWSKDDYRNEANRADSLFLIARRQTGIIGFLMLRLSVNTPDERLSSVDYEDSDLLNFGVLENFQQTGIGSRLFNAARKLLLELGVKSIWLEVRESNASAIGFYLKRGFQIMQVRNKFYSQPVENALVLKIKFE